MTDTTVKLSDATIRRRQLKEFWFYFSQNRGAVIGLGVFVLLVLTAIFAPLIAPHDPTQQYRDALLVPPIWQDGGRAGFLLGTDAVGRDMLSRLIFGAQYSLFIGIVVVAIALVGGVIKLIPGAGAVAGGVINASVAGSVTFAMGRAWMAVCQRLAKGELAGVDGALDSGAIRNLFSDEFRGQWKKRGRSKD